MSKGKLVKFLSKIKKPIGGIVDFVGDITGIEFIEKAGNIIQGSSDLTPEEKQIALQLLAQDVADRASARDMQTQISTSDNSTKLSKNYVYILASFWSLVSAIYFFAVTFIKDVANAEFANIILGFLLGTAVSAIIGFFFGSSEGSKTKDKLLSGKAF